MLAITSGVNLWRVGNEVTKLRLQGGPRLFAAVAGVDVDNNVARLDCQAYVALVGSKQRVYVLRCLAMSEGLPLWRYGYLAERFTINWAVLVLGEWRAKWYGRVSEFEISAGDV